MPNWLELAMGLNRKGKSIYETETVRLRYMPKFLDAHSLKGFEDEKILKKLQASPADEFGVTHFNMMFNKGEDKFFCLLDAPRGEALKISPKDWRKV